ncbi:hypothetical protein HY638_05930 [Candidatus Woesearchaeota archaeon]|nr:hypothetical protein [Candidatus Woesearchaeota archaeon]
MEEQECEPPARSWLGAENSNFSVVSYDAQGDPPLLLQTHQDADLLTPEVRGLIRKLVDLTGAELYATYDKKMKIDMSQLK